MNYKKLINKKDFLFDLHLDLEVYFNSNLSQLINMSHRSLGTFSPNRHFDISQAKTVKLRYLVAQVQSLIYDHYHKKIKPLKNIKFFFSNLERFLKKLKKYPDFKIIKNFSDFHQLKKNEIGVFLGIEGLNFVDDFRDIETLWQLGFRVFGLTWNFDNHLASGLMGNGSLTSLGKKIVNFLVKNEGIIDCAHLNLLSAKEVIKLAPKNFIFSHNNIKKIFNFRQNLDGQILKMINGKKTLIGLTLLPSALTNTKERQATFDDWLTHYNFLLKNYKNSIALGTDYFGFDFQSSPVGAENYEVFNKNLLKFKINKSLLFKNSLSYFYDKIKKWG
jgi:microsomal dipeptidase-like Zn-dependent dipeptidase